MLIRIAPNRRIQIIISVVMIAAKLPICLAQENLAMDKPASQSSDHNDNHNHSAGRAVDGIKLPPGPCARTKNENTPWWSVDLHDTYSIHTVKIYNRANSGSDLTCHKSSEGFRIHVSDGETSAKHLCFKYSKGNLLQIINVTCDTQVTGRRLNISLPCWGVITLCEVEVYGDLSLRTSTRVTALPTTELFPSEALPSRTDVPVSTPWDSASAPCGDDCLQTSPYPGDILAVLETSGHVQGNVHSLTKSVNVGQPLVTTLSGELLSPPAMVTSLPISVDLAETIGLNLTGLDKLTSSNSSIHDACYCYRDSCFRVEKYNETKEEFIRGIIQTLQIDTRNVTKQRRRYISVWDDRVSSTTMGYTSIAIIVLVFGPIVLADVINGAFSLWKMICS